MQSMISHCGLDCAQCPAYLATRKNDQALREKTAAEWSAMYQADIKPEQVVCEGCHAFKGTLFNHCHVCEIRKCAIEKGVQNCAHCSDYACETLTAFFNMAPEAKTNLDKIRSQLI